MDEHIRKYKGVVEGNEAEEPLLVKTIESNKEPLLDKKISIDNNYLRSIQTSNPNANTNNNSVKSYFTNNRGLLAISIITTVIYNFILDLILSYK